MALLTAIDGVVHRRTPKNVIVNMGISPGIGHFRSDEARLRQPPFNMITVEEAWSKFDVTTAPERGKESSYGLEGLDNLIRSEIPNIQGTYVEVGSYDGVTQSNSVLLDKEGWTGILIEPNPVNYAKCLRSRPNCIVEHTACVSETHKEKHITIYDVGLMSMTMRSEITGSEREVWLERGESFTGKKRQMIDVPAATLSKVLDKHQIVSIDLLLLDVEGSEIDVLSGLDFERHAPTFIVAEDAYDTQIQEFLVDKGYVLKKVLLERKFTRDCLYQSNPLL